MCLRTLRVGFERRSDVARVRATASHGNEIFLATARKIFLTKSHPLRKIRSCERELSATIFCEKGSGI
ncbi:MAG: hypothetical protein Q7S08_02365, partial [bacterium]|nr:hypothetical protein [bacterium]